MDKIAGIILVNKDFGSTSFSLVGLLRKITGERKIGHAGTLDPLATGVMVMLVGREYTRQANNFLNEDKEYLAEVTLGKSTDTFDAEGEIIAGNDTVPSQEDLDAVIAKFQGSIEQIPPMFSAKKVGGKKLYELARKGEVIERKKEKVFVSTDLLSYDYPILKLKIQCSKGTYIRSIAQDVGEMLGCGAYLSALQRTRCGNFKLEDCVDENMLEKVDISKWIKQSL
jgi:tRNA pseudouridine55 synthase